MAIIEIGNSNSYCGNCGLPASPREEGHYTNLGYDKSINGTPGCGEKWTAVRFTTYDGSGRTDREIMDTTWLPDFIKALPLPGEEGFNDAP